MALLNKMRLIYTLLQSVSPKLNHLTLHILNPFEGNWIEVLKASIQNLNHQVTSIDESYTLAQEVDHSYTKTP